MANYSDNKQYNIKYTAATIIINIYNHKIFTQSYQAEVANAHDVAATHQTVTGRQVHVDEAQARQVLHAACNLHTQLQVLEIRKRQRSLSTCAHNRPKITILEA